MKHRDDPRVRTAQMSCELKRILTFEDLSAVKRILFPEHLTADELRRDEDWDNRWSWDDAHDSDTNTENECDNQWLTKCLVTVSPFEDLIAISRKRYIAVFRIDEDATPNYHLVFGKSLPDLEPDEVITSVTFCPFISQQRSNEGSVDWTALMIGFSSGYVRIFTENGYLILSQRIDVEPVLKIQIQTFYSPNMNGKTMNSDVIEQIDEIIVFCKSVFAVIDGFNFHQTMRSLRNNLAKYQSMATASFNDMGLSLTMKKWGFQGEGTVNDAISCGVLPSCLYDHMSASSIGRNLGPPSQTPVNIIVSTGDNPFIGFSRAAQTQKNILNDMAQAFSKVKTLFPLFGKTEEKEPMDTATPLPITLSLYDQHRKGKRVFVAPSGEFAVVCDDFGRVSLVNVVKQMVVRLWKGYRDAQCAWAEVKENPKSLHSVKGLFVCIYAPRRGILEIWRCVNGPRAKVFNVGKHCRLLYTNYTMFGLNPLLYPLFEKRKISHSKPNMCYMFDCSSASLFKLDVSLR